MPRIDLGGARDRDRTVLDVDLSGGTFGDRQRETAASETEACRIPIAVSVPIPIPIAVSVRSNFSAADAHDKVTIDSQVGAAQDAEIPIDIQVAVAGHVHRGAALQAQVAADLQVQIAVDFHALRALHVEAPIDIEERITAHIQS